MEAEVLKCLKTLFNHSDGAHDAIVNNSSMAAIAASLASPSIPTRKMAAELLMFFVGREKPKGFNLVFRALEDLAQSRKALSTFDVWFRYWEEAIDGRGKMGSAVGASEAVMSLRGSGARDMAMKLANGSSSQMGILDTSLSEYAVSLSPLVSCLESS